MPHRAVVLAVTLGLPTAAVAGEHGRVGPAWGSAVIDLGEAAELNFLIVGDWGCGRDDDGSQRPCPLSHEDGRCCHGGNGGQLSVAESMSDDAASVPIDFVINAGDAMYWYGIDNVDDPKFNRTFTQVYTAESLQRPWYGVLGNHDWKKNASALVTSFLNWRVPALSYMLRGTVGGVHFTFFFIDTNYVERADICDDRNRSMWGGRHLSDDEHSACHEELASVFESQLVWLEESLRATSGHKIVVAHEPVYGAGRYQFSTDASRSEKLLHRTLGPLLRRHGVGTFISGHDHVLQHLSHRGTDFYIVGAGGAYLDDQPLASKAKTPARVLYSSDGTAHGYGRASVNATHVCVRLMAVAGGARREAHGSCRRLEPATAERAWERPLGWGGLVLIGLVVSCGSCGPGLLTCMGLCGDGERLATE